MNVMREWWGELVKTDPKVRLADLLAYRGSTLASRLGEIACPVLVVVGDADRLCPRTGAEELAGALRDARLASVADAGHALHLEKAAEVNGAIESFLTGKAAA